MSRTIDESSIYNIDLAQGAGAPHRLYPDTQLYLDSFRSWRAPVARKVRPRPARGCGAARGEVARRGIAAASIDRINEAAGYSRGAFYANYAGKHDLLLELMAEHQRREIAAWQELLDTPGTLEQVLPALRERFAAMKTYDERRLVLVEFPE